MNSPRRRSRRRNSEVIASSAGPKQSRQTRLLRFARNDGAVIRSQAMPLILLLSFLLLPLAASAQKCPEPLASARRLVLVTPETWTSSTAEVQRFSRGSPKDAWTPDSGPVSALVGLRGVGWSVAVHRLAQAGEPVKQEGDARAPAGFFKIGRSFGFAPSSLPGYLQIQPDTVCVSDPRSPAYIRLRRATRSVPRRAPKTCAMCRSTGAGCSSTIDRR
jgi:hypothetical protein